MENSPDYSEHPGQLSEHIPREKTYFNSNHQSQSQVYLSLLHNLHSMNGIGLSRTGDCHSSQQGTNPESTAERAGFAVKKPRQPVLQSCGKRSLRFPVLSTGDAKSTLPCITTVKMIVLSNRQIFIVVIKLMTI